MVNRGAGNVQLKTSKGSNVAARAVTRKHPSMQKVPSDLEHYNTSGAHDVGRASETEEHGMTT